MSTFCVCDWLELWKGEKCVRELFDSCSLWEVECHEFLGLGLYLFACLTTQDVVITSVSCGPCTVWSRHAFDPTMCISPESSLIK